jgi:hypothetical protein
MFQNSVKAILVGLMFAGLAVGCGEDDKDANGESNNSSNNNAASACERACVKISGCGVTDAASCESKCGAFTGAQLECMAATSTCSALDACISEPPADMGTTPADMGTTPSDMGSTNPDPCSRCDKSAFEACVRTGTSYTCKKTAQSCNDKFYPDICDCLYDGIGESAEGRALCSSGVQSCGYENDRQLDVACK